MSRKFKFKSKLKHKINFKNLAEDVIDSDMITGTHIQLFSNKEMTVDGCTGICDYSTDYLKLNIGKGSLLVFGGDFDIVLYEGDVITVKGNISSLEFCV